MTTKIPFHATGKLPADAQAVLRYAKEEVFGSEKVQFIPSEQGLNLNPRDMITFTPRYLVAALHAVNNSLPHITPFDCDPDEVLYFDIESHNEGRQWGMKPREFFRLGQYAWGPTGAVTLTTDYDEMLNALGRASGIIGHNIHPFDLSVLYGKDSLWPLQAAQDGRVFDTMVFANLAFPVPEVYTDRKGHTYRDADTPKTTWKWLGLDNLSYQLNLPGKIGNLQELAKKYNPPKTLVDDLDYSLIPLDDPDFLEYAKQDVVALQDLTSALLVMKDVDEYDWREQLKAAIDAQITRNGFKVDVPAAEKRRDEQAVIREQIVTQLQQDYGLPTEGKQPWRSTAGKNAIWNALEDNGINPKELPDWPKTKTGYSLGGDVLKQFTADTPAAELGTALAEIMGQRPLPQQALDSVYEDGFTHPNLTSLQRSGRTSVTKPGLTVWTSRGAGAIEKSYFVPDNDNEVLVEFDFSQADARIVAAYSGDTEFVKRFAPGSDAHEITGRLVFGDEKYDSDSDGFRYIAKKLGHAYSYRAGAPKLAATSGEPLEVAEMFVTRMEEAYPEVTKWQNRVTREGRRGFVVNDWGRTIIVNPYHAYTQAPAMYGQSGTRELMVDAMIRMLEFDVRLVQWIKVPVHDALVFSIPETELDWALPKIVELMSCTWGPSEGGQMVEFPVESGKPAKNWAEASHG